VSLMASTLWLKDGKLLCRDGLPVYGECTSCCGAGLAVAYSLTDTSSCIKLAACSATDYDGTTSPYSHGICSDGTNIWLSSNYSNKLTKIEPDGTVTDYTDKMGTENWGLSYLCWDSVNTCVWGTGNNASNGVVCKMVNGVKQATYNLPAGNVTTDIAFDGTSVWIANHDLHGVTIMLPDGTGSGTNILLVTGCAPHGLCFDCTYMWVSLTGVNSVVKCMLDGTIVGDFDSEAEPYGLAWDGEFMWCCNYSAWSVSKFAQDGDRTDYVNSDTGWKPSHIAFYDGAMYVVDENDGDDVVTKVTLDGTFSICYSREKVLAGSSFSNICRIPVIACPEVPEEECCDTRLWRLDEATACMDVIYLDTTTERPHMTCTYQDMDVALINGSTTNVGVCEFWLYCKDDPNCEWLADVRITISSVPYQSLETPVSGLWIDDNGALRGPDLDIMLEPIGGGVPDIRAIFTFRPCP
jgi:hypothetical protein